MKKEYTDQEIHLAKTLQELKPDVDNGRLAVGFIWEQFNKECSSEIKIKNSRSMGSLIRSCSLEICGGKHDSNGKRAVNCLQWNKKIESFIQTCLQSLQSLHNEAGQGLQNADIEKPMSAMSARKNETDESMQTLQTLKNQCLQNKTTVNKGDADFADFADNKAGIFKKNIIDDEVII